jgi:hypothetical protein
MDRKQVEPAEPLSDERWMEAHLRHLVDDLTVEVPDDQYEGLTRFVVPLRSRLMFSNLVKAVRAALATQAPAAEAVDANEDSATVMLAELMRGLEIPPGAAALSASALFCIGQAIAAQAKSAREAPAQPAAQPVAPAAGKISLAEQIDAVRAAISAMPPGRAGSIYANARDGLRAHLVTLEVIAAHPPAAQQVLVGAEADSLGVPASPSGSQGCAPEPQASRPSVQIPDADCGRLSDSTYTED